MRLRKFLFGAFLLLFLAAKASSAEEKGGIRTGKLFTLDEVLTRALADHPGVAKALVGVKRAKELKRAAIAKAYPELSTEVYGALATGEKGGILYSDVSLRLPLFGGGKFREERKLRSTEVELKELDSEEVRLHLAFEIRKIYYEFLSHKELTRLSQEHVRELRNYVALMRSLKEQEAITNFDLLHTETLLAKGEQFLLGHKEESDYLLYLLARFLQITESEQIEFSPVTDLPQLPALSRSRVETMAAESITEKTQQNHIERKTHELKMLRGERWPELSLSIRYNRDNDVFVDTNRFVAGLEGRFSLWDFGKLGHEIQAKAYELEEVRLEGKIAEEKKLARILRLLADLNTLTGSIRTAEAEVRERREAYKNDKAQLTAGDKGRIETLESFIELHEAQRNHLNAVTDYRVRFAEFLYETEAKP